MLFSLLLVAAACSGSDATKMGIDATDLTSSDYRFSVARVLTLTPDTLNVYVGQTARILPNFRDSKGHPLSPEQTAHTRIEYSSEDTTVAQVSTNGEVVGMKPGYVWVHGYSGGKVAKARVKVATRPAEPDTPAAEPDAPAVESDAPDTTSASKPANSETEVASKPSSSTSSSSTTTDTKPATSTTSSTPSTSTPQPTTPPASTPSASTPATSAQAPSSGNGSGLSGDAFFYDDFTRYSSTSDLKAVMGHGLGGTGGANAIYDDGLNGDLLEIDPSVTYNGHPTLKYNQPGGTVNTPQVTSYLPHTVTKMWLRVKIRYSPGFTTYGVTPNVAKAYKLLGWGWKGIDRSARIEFTNTNDYVFVWAAMSRDGTSVVGGTPDKLSGKAATEWTDGGWYDYIVYYEQTSPTTIRQRWWLARDGQKPVLRADQTGSMSAGIVAPVDRIMLGMNFNSQRPANQSQALWIAQWEVVDGAQYNNPFNVF